MLQRIWFKFALVAAVALGGGLALAPAPASAHVVVRVGVGPWWGPYYYAPPPVVYYPPPPVYYGPPPAAYAPPPPSAPPAPVEPQSQSWYYCDHPQGYYPYVTDCSSGWHQVPAHPQ